MSVSAFFKCKKTLIRMQTGPLGIYIASYGGLLVAQCNRANSSDCAGSVVTDYSRLRAVLASKPWTL